jgi:very-short-patch-repair endonuclease
MSRPFTADELDAVLAKGHVRIAGARVVALMPPEPREKQLAPPRGKRGPQAEKPARKKWSYEGRLAQQLEDAGITGFFVDAEYIQDRGLRADILMPLDKLAIEIQGAAHRIKGKWERDIEKAQATMLAGYRLLPIATKQVRDGSAVGVIRAALEVIR